MKSTTNVFLGGLRTDYHPLTQDQKGLTDALNATLITYNGNEMMLQNDMGNSRIQDSTTGNIMGLRDGFIPLGMKEHGGILYIASFNPQTKEGQLGTIPSPVFNYKYIKKPLTTIYNKYPWLSGGSQYQVNTQAEADLTHPINKYKLYREDPFRISDSRFQVADQFMISLYSPQLQEKTIRTNCWFEKSDNKIDIQFPMFSQNYYTWVENKNENRYEYTGPGWVRLNLQAETEKSRHTVNLNTVSRSCLFYYTQDSDLDVDAKMSNYWFVENSNVDNPVLLDIQRNQSTYQYMAYPNIEPGYLYTKVEPELPEDISIVSGENNSPIVCVLFDVDSFEFEVDEPWEPGKNDDPPPGGVDEEIEVPDDPNIPIDPGTPDTPDTPDTPPDVPIEKKKIVNPFVLPYNDSEFDIEGLKQAVKDNPYARLRSPYKRFVTTTEEKVNEDGGLSSTTIDADGKILSDNFFYFAMSDTLMSVVSITNNSDKKITTTDGFIDIMPKSTYYRYNYYLINDQLYNPIDAQIDIEEWLTGRCKGEFAESDQNNLEITVGFYGDYSYADIPYFNTNDPYALSPYTADELYLLIKNTSTPPDEEDDTVVYSGTYYLIKEVTNDKQKNVIEDSTGQYQLSSLDVDKFRSLFFQTRPCSEATKTALKEDNKCFYNVQDAGTMYPGHRYGTLPQMHEKALVKHNWSYKGTTYNNYYLVIFPHTYSLINYDDQIYDHKDGETLFPYIQYSNTSIPFQEINFSDKQWFYKGDYGEGLYPPIDEELTTLKLSAPRRAAADINMSTNTSFSQDWDHTQSLSATLGAGNSSIYSDQTDVDFSTSTDDFWASVDQYRDGNDIFSLNGGSDGELKASVPNVNEKEGDDNPQLVYPILAISSPILQALEADKYDISASKLSFGWDGYSYTRGSTYYIPPFYYIDNTGKPIQDNSYSIADVCVTLPIGIYEKIDDVFDNVSLEFISERYYTSAPEWLNGVISNTQTYDADAAPSRVLSTNGDSVLMCNSCKLGIEKSPDDYTAIVGRINCFAERTTSNYGDHRYNVGQLISHPLDEQGNHNYDFGDFIFENRKLLLAEYNSDAESYSVIIEDEDMNELLTGYLFRFGPTITSYLQADEKTGLITIDRYTDFSNLAVWASDADKNLISSTCKAVQTELENAKENLLKATTQQQKEDACSLYYKYFIRYVKLVATWSNYVVKPLDIIALAEAVDKVQQYETVQEILQNASACNVNIYEFEVYPRLRHWVEYLNEV